MNARPIELKEIKETTQDFDQIEKRIKEHFRQEIYYPLLAELLEPKSALQNASSDALLAALRSGRITFYRGTFSGKLNAQISKELRALGAKFSRSEGTYKIPVRSLPMGMRAAIASSESQFQKRLDQIDRKLAAVSPEAVAASIKTADLFDKTLWKTEKEFQKSVQGITISPQLTAHQRKRIADEWQTNLQLYIRDFTEKETTELRKQMQETVFSGNRYESVVKKIQESYGVTARKAKFLARQETSLLMTKFKQTRYQAAGVEWYKWNCVAGTANHPVRPLHLKNKGKYFRWDDPPVVDEQGNKKNPGQDYNCRCTAQAVVGYRPDQKGR